MRLFIIVAYIITVTTSCASPMMLRNKVRALYDVNSGYAPGSTPLHSTHAYMSGHYSSLGQHGHQLGASTANDFYASGTQSGSSAHSIISNGVRKQNSRIDKRPNLNYAGEHVQLHNVASTVTHTSATSWQSKDHSTAAIGDQHLAIAQDGAVSFGPMPVSASEWGLKDVLYISPLDYSDESAAVSAAASASASAASTLLWNQQNRNYTRGYKQNVAAGPYNSMSWSSANYEYGKQAK
ncbi:uncharacterized protein LOC128856346 [Anastrepha ludens]|uniref:uncharacterized protein LOC128856346 n=1 Tax=Anastrepha ludens TaxID=28586 RepID=UPI0023AFE7B4|nr:uncharacterized protein LOC128856346 [Anastrepha ludens]